MSTNKNIPEDYFQELPGKIMGNIEGLEDDLPNNAPLLSGYKKQNPYKVPQDYFDYVGTRIISRIKSRLVFDIRNIRPLYAAATVLLLIVAGWWSLNSPESMDAPNETGSEIYDYYAENIDLIDMSTLVDLVDENPETYFTEESTYLLQIEDEELIIYEQTILDAMTDQELLAIL